MGMSTTVYIGTYLVCTKSDQPGAEEWLSGGRHVDPKDHNFLERAKFTFFPAESIGWTLEGQEVVGFNMITVEADTEDVFERDLSKCRHAPTADRIANLKRIFGYTNVEVKQGVLVCIA